MSLSPDERVCQVKGRFFRCGYASVIGLCQYCGRLFCAKHGEILDDGQEVCSRKFCVAKRDDLVVHLVYKDAVQRRNDAGRCGFEGCNAALGAECMRCKGSFCELHVHGREEMIMQNSVRVPRMATLCRHCWVRRPIWLRT